MTARNPITARSLTLWGAGGALMLNGAICAAALAIDLGAVGEIALNLAGNVGPSVQIGTGAGLLGIRRRL